MTMRVRWQRKKLMERPTSLNALGPNFGRDLLESVADLDVYFVALPLAVLSKAQTAVRVFLVCFILCICTESATTQDVPWGECQTLDSRFRG